VFRIEQVLPDWAHLDRLAPTAPVPLTLRRRVPADGRGSNLAVFAFNRNVWSPDPVLAVLSGEVLRPRLDLRAAVTTIAAEPFAMFRVLPGQVSGWVASLIAC